MIDESLDAYSQIQKIWPTLTDDPYDLAWVVTACNRQGAGKVRQAFATCYERGTHQRDLAGPLKGYLIAICQNKDPERQRLNGSHVPAPRDHKQEMRDYLAQKRLEEAK